MILHRVTYGALAVTQYPDHHRSHSSPRHVCRENRDSGSGTVYLTGERLLLFLGMPVPQR